MFAHSPPTIRHLLTWLPLLVIAGTGLVAWGATSQRVSQLEEKYSTVTEDHDRIIRIETQMTAVTLTITEMKGNVDDLDDKLDTRFAEIMAELRRTRSRPES